MWNRLYLYLSNYAISLTYKKYIAEVFQICQKGDKLAHLFTLNQIRIDLKNARGKRKLFLFLWENPAFILFQLLGCFSAFYFSRSQVQSSKNKAAVKPKPLLRGYTCNGIEMWTARLSLSSVVVVDKDQDYQSGIGSLLLLFPGCKWKVKELNLDVVNLS